MSKILARLSVFSLIFCPTVWATDYVVFTGQTFSMPFEESKVSDTQGQIQVHIDNVLLTSTPISGGWYIERPGDRTNSFVYLKNNGIIRNKISFTVSITFATHAEKTLDFTILNAKITKDVVLPTALEPESFALMCSYNVSEGETLQGMRWTRRGAADKFVPVKNSTTRENRVTVTSEEEGTVIQLSVSRIDPGRNYRRGVLEPLTAYTGVYHCLLNVELTGGKLVEGSLAVTVSAKPTVNVYAFNDLTASDVQFRSGDRVDMLCIADGYPLSVISWVFSQRPKGQVTSTIDNVFVDIREDDSKYSIISNGTVDSLIGRSLSRLLIDHVDNVDDRGIYRCLASNSIGSDQSSHYLRIRHKYAFAVPLGGIVIQLLLFFAIIKLTEPKVEEKKDVFSTKTSSEAAKVPADQKAHLPTNPLSEDVTLPMNKSLVKPGLVRSEMYKALELGSRIEEETAAVVISRQKTPSSPLPADNL